MKEKKTVLVLDKHTNGHIAALKFMKQMGWGIRSVNFVFCHTHEALLARLAVTQCYAVVPVRNSIGGDINHVTNGLSALKFSGCHIEKVRRIFLRPEHCLCARKEVKSFEEIEQVFSKDEVFTQCLIPLLNKKIGQDRWVIVDSTTAAACNASKKSAQVSAAICTPLAAKAYGLKILERHMTGHERNTTEFLLLQNRVEVAQVTVGIIGRVGRCGTLYSKFFEQLGCKVIGSDIRLPGSSNAHTVKNADVVIFSLDIEETPGVIRSLRRHMRKDQLIMDVTSVKRPAITEMLKGPAQVVGMHPMFAPEAGFDGQTVVVCPERLDDPFWKTWVVNMFVRTQAKIKWSNPLEHDTYMATVQASPHLANLINAALIMDMRVGINESLSFTSPFYRIMFSTMGRLLHHNPSLYTSIILENREVKAMFVRRLKRDKQLLRMIRKHDKNGLLRLFNEVRDYFGKSVTSEANELFQRLNEVMKTLYGPSAVILEYAIADDKPGLLERILHVFSRRGINLTGFNFAKLDGNRMQFTATTADAKESEQVQKALAEIGRWRKPRIQIKA